jgi:hypothetical protein
MFVWIFHRVSGVLLILLVGWKIFSGYACSDTWSQFDARIWIPLHKIIWVDLLLLGLFIYHSLYGLPTAVHPQRSPADRSVLSGLPDARHGCFNFDLLAAVEAPMMINVARTIVAGALARTETRGAHARTDHPDRDDTDWLRHTRTTLVDRDVRLDYAPVDVSIYPPTERQY